MKMGGYNLGARLAKLPGMGLLTVFVSASFFGGWRAAAALASAA